MSKLVLITVTYKNYDVLKDFFSSLHLQTSKNFTVYLVDTSESSSSPKVPEFVKIINAENRGYAASINTGLREARKDGFNKFCVINNDVIVSPDFVQNTLISLQLHPRGVIGGKIYYAKGYEYHKHYTQGELGKVIWYAGGRVDWDNALTPHRGVNEVDLGQYDKFGETDFITGCLMSFDQQIIDTVGLWDESYFLYFEDADFCERAKRREIHLYYDPSIVIWHKNAQSTQGAGSKLHTKFQEKNRLRFGLKYAPWRTKIHLIKNYIRHLIA